tara:strand:- start:148 stop:312 length:165 start_codon:yes stop_codon:yes gene_type:complete
MNEKNKKEFKKEVQQILEKFNFDSETRRKIFSLVVEYATELPNKSIKKEKSNDN